MAASALAEKTTGTEAADPFSLTVTFIDDVPAGSNAAACTTNDGCGSTCASACVSAS